MKDLPKDHNLETDCPPAIKAKITEFGKAMQDYAFCGAAPLDDQEDIVEAAQIARYNLERAVLTHLRRTTK